MQFTRQDVADVPRKAGMPDAAEAALRELPEVFEDDQAGEWCLRHGLTSDQLMSMMGGSP